MFIRLTAGVVAVAGLLIGITNTASHFGLNPQAIAQVEVYDWSYCVTVGPVLSASRTPHAR